VQPTRLPKPVTPEKYCCLPDVRVTGLKGRDRPGQPALGDNECPRSEGACTIRPLALRFLMRVQSPVAAPRKAQKQPWCADVFGEGEKDGV